MNENLRMYGIVKDFYGQSGKCETICSCDDGMKFLAQRRHEKNAVYVYETKYDLAKVRRTHKEATHH
jgi:hypothetical protein